MTKKKIITLIIFLILLISIIPICFMNKINKREYDRIVINKYPNVTEYHIGEKSNFKDIKVSVIDKKGRSTELTYNDLIFSGFNSEELNDNEEIIVKYQDFTTTFSVKIIEREKKAPTLMSISLNTDNLKKTYYVGEDLNTNGGVIIREFSDGTKDFVPLMRDYVSRFDSSMPKEELKLRVAYTENGISYYADYTIEILEKVEETND